MSGFVWLFVWLKKVVSKAISSTTRPETEAGPRPVKVGLGEQESGVSGGRRGAKVVIDFDVETGTIGSVGSCILQ